MELYVEIELQRLDALEKLLIQDRAAQAPGEISLDLQTGELLGALSDAARAARYAMSRMIILRGGEDPGWGR